MSLTLAARATALSLSCERFRLATSVHFRFQGSTAFFGSYKQFDCRRARGDLSTLDGAFTAKPKQQRNVRANFQASASTDKNELFKDAAKSGDLETLRELLSSGGVDINLPSAARSGWTALQLSSFYGHTNVTRFLVEAGADLEGRNDSGNTALQFAALKGHLDVARILLDAGADIEAISNDKGSVMDYAQEWGGDDIVDFLLLWAATNRYGLS